VLALTLIGCGSDDGRTADSTRTSVGASSQDQSATTTGSDNTQPGSTVSPATESQATEPPAAVSEVTDPPTTSSTSTTTTVPTTAPTTTQPAPAAYAFPIVPASAADYARDHHDYPAADIFAECGTPYVAVTSGRIDEISAVDQWDSDTDEPALRGGLSVTLVGDDGVRYYGSHLLSIADGVVAGARVASGQQLGQVGETGNAAGTGCHVHFGISPPCGPGDWQTRRGKIWPWPYLDSWREGSQDSPVGEISSLGC
jgi:murein DD-endopeptidase MepM/ murein hydrolase activator NlpD